jgi:hypothetical protein
MANTTDATFDELEAVLQSQGPDAVFETLAGRLRTERKYHELFDVRLMQARRRMGLPVVLNKSLDDLQEPMRTKMEEAYLAACKEVGGLLLEDGMLREAWMYLRPTGDKSAILAAIEKLPADEHYESIIEIALYEGVSPKLGFQLVLEHYGCCNAISTFDSEMQNRPRNERQEVAMLLVQHLHRDLMASLRSDISRQQGTPAKETTIADLVRDRDWLFENDNYHIDTSHLNSIVRFALLIDDPATLKLAVDLTEYGKRLSPQFQFRGEPPFDDAYPTSAMFFRALLGENVDEAVNYFQGRATSQPIEEVGTGPAEVYIDLLARLGRHADAIRAAAVLLPPGTRTAGFAPTLLELARTSGDYESLKEVSRERGDLVGFAAGLVEAQKPSA